MKKITVLLLTILTGAILFAQKTINDPNAEPRNVGSGFHGIRVSNAFDVYISQGNEDAVAVSASNAEFKSRIVTEVRGGVLIIKFDQEDKKFWKRNSGQKLKAYISIKKIDLIDIGGACSVYFEDGLSAEELAFSLSGASDAKGKIEVKKLTMDISGASSATITGTAANIVVEASGASDFRAFDLVANYCDAKASGASSVNITVNKELNANASGASSVRFKGEGLIRDIKTSGASNVTRKS